MSMDDERKRRARQQAETRYGFLWHLPIYVIVNLGLVAIWFYSGQGFLLASIPDHILGARRLLPLRSSLSPLWRKLDRSGNGKDSQRGRGKVVAYRIVTCMGQPP
jgi:hypothetical protein